MKPYVKFIIAVLSLLIINCTNLPENQADKIYTEFGKASWYGPGFQGKKTASGEKFDMNKLTAAHKTIEFGTFVRITNISNQKKVIVKINDRGPFTNKRIIDLSKEAAERIDMINDGITDVKIEIVSPDEVKQIFKRFKSR